MTSRYKQKLNVFAEICKSVASLSYDPKFKVGTVIFTDDFREIVAIGYNGNYKGGPNKRDSNETGKSGFLHSEENALLHLSCPFASRDKLILMVTYKPCPMCAKRIVNAGIKKVIYINDYNKLGDETDDIFSIGNVVCEKLGE